MSPDQIAILFAVFAVAVLYSSVGHGGASGYLAVMALFAVPAVTTRPTALMLNLFVASIAFVQFFRAGHFDRRIFWAFAGASVPLAYLGGRVQLSEPIYKAILGVCLIIAAIRLAIDFGSESEPRIPPLWLCLLIGGLLGFVSGLVGVGGGIFLTPILLLMNWTETKKAAGVSALFILVNSAAGLLGSAAQVRQLSGVVFVWITAAVVGGIIGSTLGSRKFNSLTLRRLLAVGLVVAGIKLIVN